MISFFGGRVLLRGDARCATALLNLFMRLEIPYDGLSVCGDQLHLWISERNERRALTACEAQGICLSVAARRGLPQLIRRYGKRTGLVIGGILAVAILFFSSRVVWSIRVTGNRALEKEEILQMLSDCGLGSGTYLPTLDTDLVESRLLLAHREICWVSVNVRGTTVNVEVLESSSGAEESRTYANLIAACDGQIERIEAYDGNVCVKVGDVVRAGDLLVSGIYDKGLLGYRATRAKGGVYARTVREFDVEIPLEGVQKVYTGREWIENYVKFFAKRIKVFANTGKMSAECDIIYRDNGITLPDGAVLPIGVQQVVYREYREEHFCMDGEAAMEQAFLQLSQMLEKFVSDTGAELLSKTVRYELDESAYRIRCTVICIENIARVQEFDMNEKK